MKRLTIFLTIVMALTIVSGIQADTDKAKENFNAALKSAKDGEMDAAVVAYRAAIAEDPNYIDAYINLGAIFFQREDYDNALEMFRTATEKDASNAEAFANLGRVENKLKKYGEAETALKAALAINPEDGPVYMDLGKVYYSQKKYTELIDAVTKYHEKSQGDKMSWYLLGKAYENTGNTNQAIEAYRQSTVADPSYYYAHFALGQLYLSEEKYKPAASSFQAAMKAKSTSHLASYNYAIAVESSSPDNYSKNIEVWQQFVNNFKDNAKASKLIAQARDHIKELKDAQAKAGLQ
ncbi:MAG TPA: tetratricopeptide repeat protein [candidate division Zixibacteria bacterium]|nr:tetratricopeptide repeat protein [candidate division Zixibacteria bacterium]